MKIQLIYVHHKQLINTGQIIVPGISNPDTLAAIDAVISVWVTNTCIGFSKQSSRPDESSYYLNFIIGTGCYSSTGRVTAGGQDISIGNGCEKEVSTTTEYILK